MNTMYAKVLRDVDIASAFVGDRLQLRQFGFTTDTNALVVRDELGTYHFIQNYNDTTIRNLINALDGALSAHIADTQAHLHVNNTLLKAKQDKLIAGDNITIASDGKTISATGTGTSYDDTEIRTQINNLSSTIPSGVTQRVNLASTSGANSITASTIGVTGTLPVSNGGIGTTSSTTPNKVLATATSGTNATAPSFRSLVGADLPVMVGATTSSAGTIGAVPAPSSSKSKAFLRGDGTWATIGNGGSTSLWDAPMYCFGWSTDNYGQQNRWEYDYLNNRMFISKDSNYGKITDLSKLNPNYEITNSAISQMWRDWTFTEAHEELAITLRVGGRANFAGLHVYLAPKYTTPHAGHVPTENLPSNPAIAGCVLISRAWINNPSNPNDIFVERITIPPAYRNGTYTIIITWENYIGTSGTQPGAIIYDVCVGVAGTSIQIDWADIKNKPNLSGDGIYLPLAGGTMSGSIHANFAGAKMFFGDGEKVYVGENTNANTDVLDLHGANGINLRDNVVAPIFVKPAGSSSYSFIAGSLFFVCGGSEFEGSLGLNRRAIMFHSTNEGQEPVVRAGSWLLERSDSYGTSSYMSFSMAEDSYLLKEKLRLSRKSTVLRQDTFAMSSTEPTKQIIFTQNEDILGGPQIRMEVVLEPTPTITFYRTDQSGTSYKLDWDSVNKNFH